ncbi:unnamed protein product [Psylliodes chrysocephalus]|nr:unnamed protein product [Psylliodes chrysocephala]
MVWFNGKPRHLPTATGPFIPGCSDIMLDYNKTGLFLRLFYPTNVKKTDDENWSKWIPWLPNHLYLIGMSVTIKVRLYLLRLIFWWYGNYHIPVLYGEKVKTEENMKCIIFSHGLGGSRFLYSKISIDLASHGFLVACLEHRDNSSCHTYYYSSQEDAAENKKTVIDFQHIPFGENHYEKRNAQIKQRSIECIETIDFFKRLNSGTVPKNILDDVEERKDNNFRLDDLVGKIDINNFTLFGHSFGAATVLYTLPKRKEIKQTVLLDPWMFPIKNENIHEIVDIPLLFVNTQTFHIDSNVKAMAKFMTKNNREMYTIRQSTHENQTDTVLISRYWLNLFMKKIDPQQAMRINNALVLKFLHQFVNTPADVEQYKSYLHQNAQHFEEGLTKPWKK